MLWLRQAHPSAARAPRIQLPANDHFLPTSVDLKFPDSFLLSLVHIVFCNLAQSMAQQCPTEPDEDPHRCHCAPTTPVGFHLGPGTGKRLFERSVGAMEAGDLLGTKLGGSSGWAKSVMPTSARPRFVPLTRTPCRLAIRGVY